MNSTDDRLARPRSSAMLSRYLISEMVLPSLYALAAFGLVVLLTPVWFGDRGSRPEPAA